MIEQEYQKHKQKFVEEMKCFDYADSDEDNRLIKEYFLGQLAQIDALDVHAEIQQCISYLFTLISDKGNATPIQAVVFDVNEVRGQVSLSAYGPLVEPVDGEWLSLHNRANNCVFDDVGLFDLSTYQAQLESLLEMPCTEDDLDCGDETAELRYLLMLKVFKQFKEQFNHSDSDALLASVALQNPCYFFVSQHDGVSCLMKVG